jgi:peroxisomal 2,4-dienoyl-CoA reductase
MPAPTGAIEQRHKVISYFRQDAMEGRVALITGGGSGIGFEIARQFGLFKAKGIVLMGRRQAFLDKAVEMLAAEGVSAVASAGDIRKPEDCVAAVQKAVENFGGLDVVVNSAAGNFLAAAEQLSPNGFRTVMDIDAMGVFNMAHAAFEELKKSSFGGVITNITATLHWTATWYQTAPVAAKAAIEAMTRNLALEWGDFGIRCNCIAPGPIAETPGLEKLSGGNSNLSFPHVPMKRAGTKAEISSTAIFFCLNEYITGQVLAVDGGDWFGKQPYMSREVVAGISRKVEKGSRDMGPGAAPPSKL